MTKPRYVSPLRSLAQDIYDVAKDHAAYSQVYSIVQNCVDHINAVARINEVHQNYPGDRDA